MIIFKRGYLVSFFFLSNKFFYVNFLFYICNTKNNKMENIKQEVEVKKLENGNITIHVTDKHEFSKILDYTWTLQNLSPETVEELIKQLRHLNYKT